MHYFGGEESTAETVAALKAAEADGFTHVWMPQIFAFDTITMIAAVAHEVQGLTFGTAVVPTYPRHPLVLAQQALTVAAVTDGRLVLGIGLSHQVVIEAMLGMSFDKPLRHLREFLSILLPLLHDRRVSYRGETLACRAELSVKGPTPPVLVAALGPKMLELAGARTDGTITWMAGPKTIASHIAPILRAAAEEAGRAVPQIVSGFPVCVTDAPDAARARAAKDLTAYGQLPSYRAMLAREGVSGPEDIAIVGDEDQVTARFDEVAAAGVTDLMAYEFGSTGERARTRALLNSVRARYA
jgi:5,10-methylenetetrahydromethanopterin reductase